MVFDPTRISDGACVEGHLDAEPIYDVLLTVHRKQVTGRLTIQDAAGANHMYFMQGRPVGVLLAEYVHPLGQLLLELGRINGVTFVRAQRLIAEGNRLAGQVFKELGVLDDKNLREVLFVQARKKAEHLCRLGSRSFSFCSGLTYLVGFTSTPLDIWVVVYLAVRAQLGPEARAALIDGLQGHQVRVTTVSGDTNGLPTSLEAFGFGAAEERFLQRILGGWEKVDELCETGTLPADEAAVLLRFLEVIGRLERRRTPQAVTVSMPAPVQAAPPVPGRPAATRKPDGDDVFSSAGPERAPRPAQRAPVADLDVFASPDEATGPQSAAPLRAGRGQSPASTVPGRPAAARTTPDRPPVARTVPERPVSRATEDRPPPKAAPERPMTPRPMAPAAPDRAPPLSSDPRRPRPASPPVQSAPVAVASPPEDDMPAPVVKAKKKVRRTEPLPSEGSGLLVSETRKERTNVGPMPTIVIEDD